MGTLNGVGGTIGSAAERIKTPAMVGTAAAAGLAGVALGARALSHGSRSLVGRNGSRLPAGGGKALKSAAGEVGRLGKEIGKRGFRLGVGDIDMEVRRGRSKRQRQSPVEVLLHSLTSRRQPD